MVWVCSECNADPLRSLLPSCIASGCGAVLLKACTPPSQLSYSKLTALHNRSWGSQLTVSHAMPVAVELCHLHHSCDIVIDGEVRGFKGTAPEPEAMHVT